LGTLEFLSALVCPGVSPTWRLASPSKDAAKQHAKKHEVHVLQALVHEVVRSTSNHSLKKQITAKNLRANLKSLYVHLLDSTSLSAVHCQVSKRLLHQKPLNYVI